MPCMTSKITKREAAEMLGVTPSAVHRMIDRGELVPAETIMSVTGRAILHTFRRRDVERLTRKREAA